MLGWIWSLMVLCSLLFGAWHGTLGEVSAAALEGAGDAVTVVLSLVGTMALWSGVTEALRRAGALSALSRLFRPLLRRFFPGAARHPETAEAVSANVTANLLGLGNAATPAGIRAASLMAAHPDCGPDRAAFLLLNTASIQLIPTTAAALRGSLGAAAPFDILPAVWCASAAALTAGAVTLWLLRRITVKR